MANREGVVLLVKWQVGRLWPVTTLLLSGLVMVMTRRKRNIPVVMVKRRAVPVGDVSSVSTKTKFY